MSFLYTCLWQSSLSSVILLSRLIIAHSSACRVWLLNDCWKSESWTRYSQLTDSLFFGYGSESHGVTDWLDVIKCLNVKIGISSGLPVCVSILEYALHRNSWTNQLLFLQYFALNERALYKSANFGSNFHLYLFPNLKVYIVHVVYLAPILKLSANLLGNCRSNFNL